MSATCRKPGLNQAPAAGSCKTASESKDDGRWMKLGYGNGRVARMLGVSMGLQAGYPALDFSQIKVRNRRQTTVFIDSFPKFSTL